MPKLNLSQTSRDKVIVKTSIISILMNIFLASFKAVIGLISNSIAIILDAVNNLSDALSSIITIIGTKLSAKDPDKKHPLGYGRIEYLSASIVAAIVLYAGFTSFIESIKGIINPRVADYSTLSLVIIIAAIIIKLGLGIYVKKIGSKVKSGALIASGVDSLFDSILSLSVLLCAIIYMIFNVSLEAWVGVIISIVIIKSGIEMMLDTLNDILGKRVDREFVSEIKSAIEKHPEVNGAYDLFLYNYGPDNYYGSVHVEVSKTMTAGEIDIMSREIMLKIYQEYGLLITGIGIYAVDMQDTEIIKMRKNIFDIVDSHKEVIQMHGFFIEPYKKQGTFDLIIDFDVTDREKIYEQISQEIKEEYPDYEFKILRDIDV